jgi:hypothetical protein
MDASPDLLGAAVAVLAVGFAIEVSRIVREQPPSDPSRPSSPPPRTDPPRGVSVLVAAHVTRWRRRSASAQLAELVRRGALRVVPDRPATVEVADPSGLDPVEAGFVEALVRGEPRVGSRAELRADDRPLAWRVRDAQARVNDRVVGLGLRRRITRPRLASLPRIALVVLTGVATVLAVHDSRAWFVAGSLGFASLLPRRRDLVRPLSTEGAALRDHVRGIDEWLRFADLSETADLDALLPWAVLFGRLQVWTARGGALDPALAALLAALGADVENGGTEDEQVGDVWGDQATGGSRAEHDGAYVPPTD